MAGDTVSCSGRFCVDETIIMQECSHTQTAWWQPCLKFGGSHGRICLCLLVRGCADFGIVDVSCSWLVLHSQQSQSFSSSSPSYRPKGSRNWRAIKGALKRSNCQCDCLHFSAVKEWKYRSRCNEDRVNSFWKYISMCPCATASGR